MSDVPRAPDGSDRGIGEVRIPDPPDLRGPAAGVPDVSFGLAHLVHGQRTAAGEGPLPSDLVRFQHRSEQQFARLLDHYGIAWEYEPHTFPLAWGDDGAVVRAFAPDFLLPGFGTYIEITTSQQRLVTKKNRKLRRMRELYPDVPVKLFYQRDFLAIARRFAIDLGTS